ncbi:Putative glycosyltransferase TagX [Frankliniella fusca]|uniref:Glycosyltransferase TagX n=1 Tax=Frankliniella fusca TaxID=407009 RepID=A0AAE1HR19_9NEOP|nr:Putative glycosyltransferase TagX [Frankliniella fusca]
MEDLQRRKERLERLEGLHGKGRGGGRGRLPSERVYREADHLDEQADALRRLGEAVARDIQDMNEMEREIAKENLELETKLHKERFLFKRQLEEFQKDLLEVETDLLTGNINRKARATKNIVRPLASSVEQRTGVDLLLNNRAELQVTQLVVLRDCITQQNDELWRELRDKDLSIGPRDSVASATVAEEDFHQYITDKMRKMELLIKEDLDRRALCKPKKFVFEAPGTSRIPFRGQRNVIKVSSKAASEWRKKTTFEIHRQEAMERQVENLRRDILHKLGLEKEKAKKQLMQYEAQRRGSTGPPCADLEAAKELRLILTQLDAFLDRYRRDKDSASGPPEPNEEPDPEEDFGREIRTLVLQLDKLQSALEGDKPFALRDAWRPGLRPRRLTRDYLYLCPQETMSQTESERQQLQNAVDSCLVNYRTPRNQG